MSRPNLDSHLDSETFLKFYYLKEELVDFCRKNHLPVSGGKIEITNRIAHFLDTGEIWHKEAKQSTSVKRRTAVVPVLSMDAKIEPDFVCTEAHRAFFKEHIGKGFSFPVAFQKWLKQNTGKTYAEAVDAYYRILEEKKTKKSTIEKQFEYNTYIRDFFAENPNHSLSEAIACWKYKKQLPGHNRYESTDLVAQKE